MKVEYHYNTTLGAPICGVGAGAVTSDFKRVTCSGCQVIMVANAVGTVKSRKAAESPWHYMAAPGVTACGADYPDLCKTSSALQVTCRVCLDIPRPDPQLERTQPDFDPSAEPFVDNDENFAMRRKARALGGERHGRTPPFTEEVREDPVLKAIKGYDSLIGSIQQSSPPEESITQNTVFSAHHTATAINAARLDCNAAIKHLRNKGAWPDE